MSDRLTELASVGYEAFRRSCGELDPSNGCRMASFSQLPLRVQGGWRDGVRAVLGAVYVEQEAARASAEAALAEASMEEAVASAELAQEPAGRSAVRKPRKLEGGRS